MSGIPVACGCGQQFVADADRAGQVLNCPVCGQPISIPAASHGAVTPDPSLADPALADPPVWRLIDTAGQQYGPLTKAQLDEAAVAGQFDGSWQVYREGEAAPRSAIELYPAMAAARSLSAAPASAASSTATPQKKTASGGGVAAMAGGALQGIGMFGAVAAVVIGGLGLAAFVLFRSRVGIPMGKNDGGYIFFLIVLLAGGFFTFVGALREWRTLFESRKAAAFVSLFGYTAARYFYMGLGALMLTFGCLMSVGSALKWMLMGG